MFLRFRPHTNVFLKPQASLHTKNIVGKVPPPLDFFAYEGVGFRLTWMRPKSGIFTNIIFDFFFNLQFSFLLFVTLEEFTQNNLKLSSNLNKKMERIFMPFVTTNLLINLSVLKLFEAYGLKSNLLASFGLYPCSKYNVEDSKSI